METSGHRHVVNSSMLTQLRIVTGEFMVSVGGWARNPTMAKLLYAGPTKSITSGSTNIATVQSSKAVSSLGDVVQISDAAKAALKEMRATKTEVTPTLKSKVEKLFQEARDRGSMISFDSSKGGEWMDMSSFTDDELAKIRLDKGADFPQDLSDYAEGALGQRLRVSLEPYEGLVNNGDRRAHVMTIQKLYEQMTPDVRAALNWTPAMMANGQHMLDGDNRRFGSFNMDTVESNLIDAAKRGGLSYSAARTVD